MCLWLKKWKEKRLLKKIALLQRNRENNQVNQQKLDDEIKLLNELFNFYHKNRKNKNFPLAKAAQENCMRMAVSLGDQKALLWLGKTLLEEAKERDVWQRAGVLANTHNQKVTEDLFFQAHGFLKESAKINVDAQRLLALCSIHGWGEPIDRKKGFGLLVESINREDSWDKLPEIFAKIGLNKPEFLKELIKFRTQGGE
jgi:hypothetical protein